MGREDAQLRNLQYVDRKPAFIQRMMNGGGAASGSSNGDRPPIPERPADDPGSDSDDEVLHGGEEGPEVVVLKEGKHLSAADARAEIRRAKGLPPEATPKQPETAETAAAPTPSAPPPKDKDPGMVFGSSGKAPTKKRKGIAVGQEDDEAADQDSAKPAKAAKKKSKSKQAQGALSFD